MRIKYVFFFYSLLGSTRYPKMDLKYWFSAAFLALGPNWHKMWPKGVNKCSQEVTQGLKWYPNWWQDLYKPHPKHLELLMEISAQGVWTVSQMLQIIWKSYVSADFDLLQKGSRVYNILLQYPKRLEYLRLRGMRSRTGRGGKTKVVNHSLWAFRV